jgi:hypothetical protein
MTSESSILLDSMEKPIGAAREHSLVEALKKLRDRVRALSLLMGAAMVFTVAVWSGLIYLFTDYWLGLPALPRMGLFIAALATIAYAGWQWLLSLLFRPISLRDVAARVEQAFPQYQDRLSSSIEFLSGGEAIGSAALKDVVVSQAQQLTQGLDLKRAIVLRPLWHATIAAAASLLIVLTFIGGVSPQWRNIAVDRLLRPFQSNPWPKRVVIQLSGEVPDRLPVGQPLEIKMHLARGDSAARRATIFYQYGDASGRQFGPVEQEYMTRGIDGFYHANIDSQITAASDAGTLKVWMSAGDDQVNLQPIRIVPRLAIKRIEAQITPPPYVHAPASRQEWGEAPVNVTLGSVITLKAIFNKPLDPSASASLELLDAKSKPTVSWTTPDGNSVTATIDATSSFGFHLHAKDIDGFPNLAAEEFDVVVRPDQMPSVTIQSPRENEDRTPQAVVPIQLDAEDDFDIASVMLVVNKLGDRSHWEIPLVERSLGVGDTKWSHKDSSSQLQRFEADYGWNLSQLSGAPLRSGDVLEYFAAARDNFDLHGQTHPPVASGRLKIVIISQDDLSNQIADQIDSITEQAASLRKSQQTTHLETAQLASEIAGKPTMNQAAASAADRLSSQQAKLAQQTQSLASDTAALEDRLKENNSDNADLLSTATDLSGLLDHAAQHAMKTAADELDIGRQSASIQGRDRNFADAQSDQSQAEADLQKAVDRAGGVGGVSRSLESIQNALNQQQGVNAATIAVGNKNVGKSRDEMSADDQKKLDDLARQQADLSAKTSKMLEQLARDAKKLARSDAAAAQTITQAIDTANQQNIAGNQSSAADALADNRQGEAQSLQKNAEAGLAAMKNLLEQVKQRQADQQAAQLAAIQQQLEELIRQQADHNLYTLKFQGGDALQVDAAVLTPLFADAQRDPSTPLPALSPDALASAQEQTESDARDLARSAGDVPGIADTSALLTSAADDMATAVLSLRESKWADAYAGPEASALAALRRAKTLVDAQKDAADKKKDQEKKKTIQQQYGDLLTLQEAVNKSTAAIDQAPRDDDGALPRELQLRLRQLPDEQDQIATKAAAMTADLATLQSIVYSFANRDLVKSMQQVRDQLAVPNTGSGTQIQEQQIASELDSLANDINAKPKTDAPKKEKKGGGKDSGGGFALPPSMPSEAEFRLLKDLQIAQNNATTALSKQPTPDPAALVALGSRQGELRSLLDNLLKKSSKGKLRLRPEPDNRDELPEEMPGAQSLDSTAIDSLTVFGQAGAEAPDSGASLNAPEEDGVKDVNRIGDRMSRVRQRLALNGDAGPVTQEIQKRIIANLDFLIDANRRPPASTQSSATPPPPPPASTQPNPGGGPPPPPPPAQPQNGGKPGDQNKKPSQLAAGAAKPGSAKSNMKPATPADASADASKQESRMWGAVTPRQRSAVIEGEGEQVLDKYKDMVDDYYRTLSTQDPSQPQPQPQPQPPSQPQP